MTAQEIVERIMTAHWDMAACPCWVCSAGRELGFAPRDGYQLHKYGNRERYSIPIFDETSNCGSAAPGG